jgi:polyisoprenoid-binding protein YceI
MTSLQGNSTTGERTSMTRKHRLTAMIAPMMAIVAAANCGRGDAAADSTTRTQTSGGEVQLPSAGALHLVVAPTGNEVRYRIREQLVGLDLPNDAVGATSDVTGGITFDANGRVVPSASRFQVSIGTLTSDKARRDGYVRGRILQASEHPTVELVPTAIEGLTLPIPTSGTKTFTLVGNLTVRGVTRPTTWLVNAKFGGSAVTGTAATAFTFAEFGLTQPRVPVVLSVADTIKLEYDFSLEPAGTKD